MSKTKEALPLESAMQQLEELVVRMESGDLSLDDSLKAFEQGIELSKQCQHALKQAEQRVKMLLSKTSDAEPVNVDNTPSTPSSKNDIDANDELPF